MPTALSTTKRKFHKLLDSISNTSSSSLPLPPSSSTNDLRPSTSDGPSKRPRTERPATARDAATSSPRFSTSAYLKARERIARPLSTSAASTTRTPTKSSEAKNKEGTPSSKPSSRPGFAPWDRSQFLARLETFRHVDKWTGKSDQINEVEWAKRGWSCVGKERVQCVGGCHKEVVISLEDEVPLQQGGDTEGNQTDRGDEDEDDQDWRLAAQEELVTRYAEMISTAHDEGCLWRRRGCDDTIQRLPIVHYQPALASLHSRYTSLLSMSSELPASIVAPPSFDITKLKQVLTPIFHNLDTSTSAAATASPSDPQPESEPQTAPSLNEPALILALLGWQAPPPFPSTLIANQNNAAQAIIPPLVPGLVTCQSCFRRLGLWLFNTTTSSSFGDEREPSMSILDPIAEHRDYCPWINAVAQNGVDVKRRNAAAATTLSSSVAGEEDGGAAGLAGWEGLVRTVLSRSGNTTTTTTATSKSRGRAGHSHSRSRSRNDGDGDREGEEAREDDVGVEAENEDEDEEKKRTERDKERWRKLKRVSQMFRVKTGGGGGGGGGSKVNGNGGGTRPISR